MRANLDSLVQKVERIVGREHVKRDPERITGIRSSGEGIATVYPGSEPEVQEIVREAGRAGVCVMTSYQEPPNREAGGRGGLFLDFSRMDAIERVDEKNLIVHVQRGARYEDLQKELSERGLRILMPAAAESPLVACNQANRCIHLAASRYPEVQVSNLRVVLANGKVHKTGSHALSEETSDCKEDGGPNLSRWYLGSEDIFGIMTRASLYLYPERRCRRALAYGFEDVEEAIRAARQVARHELPIECLVLNRVEFARRFGDQRASGLSWTMVVGLGGRERLVNYQARRVDKILTDYRCEKYPEADDMSVPLEIPWYVTAPFHFGFYSRGSTVKRFQEIVVEGCEKGGVDPDRLGLSLVLFSRGACLHNHYNLYNGAGVDTGLVDRICLDLLREGAYFDLPRGRLAERIFGSMPAMLEFLKRIKGLTDPEGLLNPGRPVNL